MGLEVSFIYPDEFAAPHSHAQTRIGIST